MLLLQSQNILFSIQKDKTQIILRPNAIKNDDAFFHYPYFSVDLQKITRGQLLFYKTDYLKKNSITRAIKP